MKINEIIMSVLILLIISCFAYNLKPITMLSQLNIAQALLQRLITKYKRYLSVSKQEEIERSKILEEHIANICEDTIEVSKTLDFEDNPCHLFYEEHDYSGDNNVDSLKIRFRRNNNWK